MPSPMVLFFRESSLASLVCAPQRLRGHVVAVHFHQVIGAIHRQSGDALTDTHEAMGIVEPRAPPQPHPLAILASNDAIPAKLDFAQPHRAREAAYSPGRQTGADEAGR